MSIINLHAGANSTFAGPQGISAAESTDGIGQTGLHFVVGSVQMSIAAASMDIKAGLD